MKIRTRYLILATAIVLAVSAAATIWLLTHTRGGSTATVYVDGDAVRTIDLSAPGDFDIETVYGFNRLSVEDGAICVSDADCRDKLCVGMGRRGDGSVPIVCLPHHLVIRIDGEQEDGVDAVAGVAP